MKLSSKVVRIILIIIIIGFPIHRVYAGTYIGAKWDKNPLIITYDLSGLRATKDLSVESWKNEIRAAFNIWNDAAKNNNVQFLFVEDSNDPDVKLKTLYRSPETITRTTILDCSYIICFIPDPNFPPYSKKITRAEVVFYPIYKGDELIYKPHTIPELTQDPDVQSAMLHEIGHVLGLDHSTDCSAVMFGDDCAKEVYNGYWGNLVKAEFNIRRYLHNARNIWNHRGITSN